MAKGKNPHAGHRQRVRNRYLSEGLDAFEDHQVIELLLFYSIPRRDTNKLAHRMLDEFGSLPNLLEADPQDISRRCKVSENTAILLSLIPSLARRYFASKWGDKPVLNSTSRAGEYAISLFVGMKYEVFNIICLDNQNRVNYAGLIQKGTINETPVYPRKIIEAVLRHQASKLILAHNHPGGSLRPSNADIAITKKIMTAVEAIDVEVIDHIIVAGDKYLSFAEEGIMRKLQEN